MMTRSELVGWLDAFRWNRSSWATSKKELMDVVAKQREVGEWLAELLRSERPEVRWELESVLDSMEHKAAAIPLSVATVSDQDEASAPRGLENFTLPAGFRWLSVREARAAKDHALARHMQDARDGVTLYQLSPSDFAVQAQKYHCVAEGPRFIDRHGKSDVLSLWAHQDTPTELLLALTPALPQQLFIPIGRDEKRLHAALETYGARVGATSLVNCVAGPQKLTSQESVELVEYLRERVSVDADDLWPTTLPDPTTHRVFFGMANSISDVENGFVVHPVVDSRPEKLASVTQEDVYDPVALFVTIHSQSHIRLEFHQVFGDGGPILVIAEARYLPHEDTETVAVHNKVQKQDHPLDMPVDVAAALMQGMSWSQQKLIQELDKNPGEPAVLLAALCCLVRDPAALTPLLRPFVRSPSRNIRGSIIVAAGMFGLSALLPEIAAYEKDPVLLEHLEHVKSQLQGQ